MVRKERREIFMPRINIFIPILFTLLSLQVKNVSDMPLTLMSQVHIELNKHIDEAPSIKRELFSITLQRLLIGMCRENKFIRRYKSLERIALKFACRFAMTLRNEQISKYLPRLMDKELMFNGDFAKNLPQLHTLELKLRSETEFLPVVKGFYPTYLTILSKGIINLN